MNLSKRLSAVASMVTQGNIVADIGTDHGYIPIYLVKEGICPAALALDIKTGPLERAREHISAEGLSDRITLLQSDGMRELDGRAVDSVVIAGMGGGLICRILEDSPILQEIRELILSPHSEVDKVRKCILQQGFDIVDEKMVEDAGKYYHIIKACQAEETGQYTEFDFMFGKKMFESRDPVFYEYLLKMRDKYTNIGKKLHKNGLSERNKEIAAMLRQYEAAIDRWNGRGEKYGSS